MLHRKRLPFEKYKSSTEKNEYQYLNKTNNEIKGNGNKTVIEYGNDFIKCKIISDKMSN